MTADGTHMNEIRNQNLKSEIMKSLPNSVSRIFQAALLCLTVFAFLGASDEGARFNNLGHRLMCVCGCNQILLECNHVGCTYSDRMRGELMAGLDRGENDDLTLQDFVQKYGPTVLAAPTGYRFQPGSMDHAVSGACPGLADHHIHRAGVEKAARAGRARRRVAGQRRRTGTLSHPGQKGH